MITYPVKHVPRVYPTMSYDDFAEQNVDIWDWYDSFGRPCNEEVFEYMIDNASKIKNKKPSAITTFPSEVMAKNFMNIKHKQGMIYFPVWSKNDNNFLLFFIGMR